MFEKIEAINLDSSKKEKQLETINELSIHETDLLEKAQKKIPEEKRGKFEKMKEAFLAITAGVMLLGAIGCGYPFIMQRAIVGGNLDKPTTAEIFLGPAAYPIDTAKNIIEHAFEGDYENTYFFKNNIVVYFHLKNKDEQIIKILNEFIENGWIETDKKYYEEDKGISLCIQKSKDETFYILGSWASEEVYFVSEDGIKKEDLLKNIEKVISEVEKEKITKESKK